MRKISDIDKTIKSYEAGYKVGFSDAKRIILENLITEVGNYELRELKAYKEELPKEIKNAKVRQANALEANVKNENYNPYLAEYIKGYLCGLSYTEGIIAKIIEEVAADDSSRTIE